MKYAAEVILGSGWGQCLCGFAADQCCILSYLYVLCNNVNTSVWAKHRPNAKHSYQGITFGLWQGKNVTANRYLLYVNVHLVLHTCINCTDLRRLTFFETRSWGSNRKTKRNTKWSWKVSSYFQHLPALCVYICVELKNVSNLSAQASE